jgi:COMPASS component SWD3
MKKFSVHFEHKNSKNTGLELFCLKFCMDDELLAAGYSDGSLRIYSIPQKKVLYTSKTCLIEEGSAITSLRWRPNLHISTKQVLVTVNSDGSIIHWYAQKGKMLHKMYEKNHSILCMDYNLEGSRLATAGKDFHVRVYDEDIKSVIVDFGSAGWKYSGHNNRVFGVKFLHDNPNLLMSGGWDSNLLIWDMRIGESIGSCPGPNLSGDSLDYKDGQILTGSYRSKD